MNVEQKNELRHRARTDLFWLGTKILGYDFQPDVHQTICDFFVAKDRNRSFAEQDTIHNRLLLDPRGHYKTTIDIADIVQWILNFPDVRILIMSGKQELAERMLSEVKQHFTVNEKMRALFPEFCGPEGKELGNMSEFTSPARKVIKREPTVSISTITSTRASMHFDIIKFDDVVNEENSATQDLITKVKRGIDYTSPLLDPGGYRDFIGTRYDHSDYYGYILESREWERDARGLISKDGLWLCHQRKCWVEKENEVKLLFPRRKLDSGKVVGFTVAELKSLQQDDPYIFNCQYLNDPTPTVNKSFTETLILAHTIPHEQIPKQGRIFITWDFGFSQKEFADWSVGAIGLYDGTGRLFILDLIVGRFSANELVQWVFDSIKHWKPVRVGIEAAAGSLLIQPALELLARQHRVYLPIEWIKVKNTKGAKEERIASLHPLLEQNKLYFSARIFHADEMMKQFTRFPKYKHDDIPDAISLLLNFRDMVDIPFQDNEVEFVSAPVYEGCELLGAGLVG